MANKEFNKMIGGIIKKCREKRGLKQSELADRMGVTPANISNYERGYSCPGVETLFVLMKALGYMVVFRPIETTGRKYYKEIKKNV